MNTICIVYVWDFFAIIDAHKSNYVESQ